MVNGKIAEIGIVRFYTPVVDAAAWWVLMLVSIFFVISVFFLGGCHGQVGGTKFHVGMTAADQRRYLRPDE